jgi:streptomycin 6-kinase
VEIPEKVRRKAALMGGPGRAWLAGLPRQIAELERRWAMRVGRPARRGSEAFVAEARTSDGRDVMVKIVIPGIDPTRQELRILRAADGAGYARLIRGDEASNAMLLERLGPPLQAPVIHYRRERCHIGPVVRTLRALTDPLLRRAAMPLD